jgi:hypothetical protein
MPQCIPTQNNNTRKKIEIVDYSVYNADGKELSSGQKINLDLYFILHTKTNSRCVFEKYNFYIGRKKR